MGRPVILPLTSFRFFAALLVVIFHYDRKLLIFPIGLANFGYEAVTFFFILSGFILTYTHGKRDGPAVSNRRFAILRSARIIPAYLLALVVCGPFLVAANIKSDHSFLPDALLVPTILQSWWPPSALAWNSPAWSLSNEVFFYALYPLIWGIFIRLTPARSLFLASAMIMMASIARNYLPDYNVNWHNFGAYFPLLNLPQFVLGVALGKLFVERGPSRQSDILAIAAMITLGAVITLKADHSVDDIVLCLIFGPMLYGLAGVGSMLRTILSTRSLVVLGDASYAIYILHVPMWLWWDRMFRVSFGFHIQPLTDFLAYLASVLAVSILVNQLLEKPIGRWAKEQLMIKRCDSIPLRGPGCEDIGIKH